MARNRGGKEGLIQDPSVGMPAEKASESVKKKIAKIFDMFPQVPKDMIAKILQFYSDDENQAVDAITRDGGAEALRGLSNLADAEKIKNKNNKNKKRKKKGKKDAAAGIAATASFDADDSSSLHSGGNMDGDVEKDSLTNENGVGGFIEDEVTIQPHPLSYERLNSSETEYLDNDPENEKKHRSEGVSRSQSSLTQLAESKSVPHISGKADSEIAARGSPLSDSTDDQCGGKKEKFRSIIDGHHKQSPRQRTSSFRRVKSSSISEDAPSHYNPQAAATPTKRGFERCKKDLSRQSISLQRIHSLLDKGLEESDKKVKHVFSELQKMIDNRQKEVELELEKTRQEAFNLLKTREDLAIDLKRRLDRTSNLTEAEWSDLRSDIKQFVTERKYDDDLGKTIWFQWSDMSEVIKSFGEVQPVKNVYSQRSHSISGNMGAANNTEPPLSPTSSIANEDVEFSAYKNDVATTHATDTVPATGKDESAPFHKNQSENKFRVFSNKNFQRNSSNHPSFQGNRDSGYNNRDGGYNNRGRGSRGYSRTNYKNYYNYPRQPESYGYDNNYNRGPPQGHFPPERNVHNTRDNRNDRGQRRPNSGYRFQNRAYRGNSGGHRPKLETTADAEPVVHAANENAEKSNVLNGFEKEN